MEIIRRPMVFSLFAISLLGCAAQTFKPDTETVEKSQQCNQLREKFKAASLDLEMFRDAGRDDTNEIIAAVSSQHVYPSSPPVTLIQEVETLKYYAGKTCGFKNMAASNDNTVGSKYYSAGEMYETLKRYAGFHSSWLAANSTFSAVDTSRPVIDTSKFKYPSYKGEWKETAENRRKEFFQKAILNKLLSIRLLVSHNKRISELLDSKTIHPLSLEQRNDLEGKFDGFLKEYDIDLSQRKDVDQALDDIKIDVGNATGDLAQYTFRSTSDYKEENFSGSEAPTTGNLLKDKAERIKLLTALLIINSKIEAKRLNPDEFQITLTIDFPSIFRTYPLRNISEFTE